MSARYTLAEFKSAGLEPQECDTGPYTSSLRDNNEEDFWHPCSYHEGYIDGFENGAATALDGALPEGLPIPTHGIEGITKEDVDEFLRGIDRGDRVNTYVLKIEPHWFDELESRRKTCEIRLNDRDFQRYDLITVQEYIPATLYSASRCTGRELTRSITHVYSGDGVAPGYVVLSLAVTE